MMKNWILTDTDTNTHLDQFAIGGADLGGAARACRIEKRTLRAGRSAGVDSLTVDNGTLSIVILPTRGMGLWKAYLGPDEIGWRSPVRGPVHPSFVPLGEPSGLGWLDGFDELLVRCGLESNGAPEFDDQGRLKYPLHGRIANCPAHKVEVGIDTQSGEITVVGVVEETRFLFSHLRMTTTVRITAGEPAVRIRDEIENLSASPAEFQMLYHINFGQPLLDAGSRLLAPVKTLVPRNARAAQDVATWDNYAAPESGFVEQVYLLELLAQHDGQTRTLLKNAAGTKGVSLLWIKNQLPCYTLWKNTNASADGYVTGLEPGTNFPNPRSYEAQQGRTVTLPPGGIYPIDVALEFHRTAAEVERAEIAVAELQRLAEPSIYRQPQPPWSTA